jgi:hypothetical protein
MKRETEARLHSPGQWGVYGNSHVHMRYAAPRPQMRRRCGRCGDDGRKATATKATATHVGMTNGVALTSGCEWHVYQWIKEAMP